MVAHFIGSEGELRDVDSHWSETYGIEADDALLVRPDGFVAWRQRGMVRDAQTELSHVVDQLVGSNRVVFDEGDQRQWPNPIDQNSNSNRGTGRR